MTALRSHFVIEETAFFQSRRLTARANGSSWNHWHTQPAIALIELLVVIAIIAMPLSAAEPRPGSVDLTIGTGAGSMRGESIPGLVKRIVLQSDGRILVSGGFDGFDGVPRSDIIRLNGDSPLLRLGSPHRLPDGRVEISVTDFTGRTTVLEAATELSPPNWQPIWTNTVSSGSFTVIDPGGSVLPRRFYRVLAR